MLRCAACGCIELRGAEDDTHIVDHNDLDLAIHSVTKGMGDEAQRLPEILHHLIRAVPDLYPLAAVLERETGRRLTP